MCIFLWRLLCFLLPRTISTLSDNSIYKKVKLIIVFIGRLHMLYSFWILLFLCQVSIMAYNTGCSWPWGNHCIEGCMFRFSLNYQNSAVHLQLPPILHLRDSTSSSNGKLLLVLQSFHILFYFIFVLFSLSLMVEPLLSLEFYIFSVIFKSFYLTLVEKISLVPLPLSLPLRHAHVQTLDHEPFMKTNTITRYCTESRDLK